MFRIEPNGPAGAYKTYSIDAPRKTHWRTATCEEVECKDFLRGWKTVLSITQVDMIEIARRSGYSFTEERDEATVTFIFEAGQKCFKRQSHKLPLGKDGIYRVRPGDWRISRSSVRNQIRTHARPIDWVEDMQENQAAIQQSIDRG